MLPAICNRWKSCDHQRRCFPTSYLVKKNGSKNDSTETRSCQNLGIEGSYLFSLHFLLNQQSKEKQNVENSKNKSDPKIQIC